VSFATLWRRQCKRWGVSVHADFVPGAASSPIPGFPCPGRVLQLKPFSVVSNMLKKSTAMVRKLYHYQAVNIINSIPKVTDEFIVLILSTRQVSQ
jgi:hypothetical protein